ncbi:MAG: ribonuclease H-like domain-containing protein [Anaerolineae bacterium]|nr:ribonuclease H-like domain-containing protein [Anaerolineae bacterium]
MDEKTHRKLQRMGVTRGLKKLQSPPLPAALPLSSTPSSKTTLPGTELPTAHGRVWVDRHDYSPEYAHGRYRLDAVANISAATLALLGAPGLGPRPVFLDTETTGLGGGAGTLVFLTGVGVWDGSGLSVFQVFLRDPVHEIAALRYLDDLVSSATGLVTFNGRGFDVPLLQNRFILNRLAPRWAMLPHLDLLSVARQLWRDHFPSRRLGVLETEVLRVKRAEVDIDSALIPALYLDYLRTGEPGEMARIFYHNLVDVVSLVALLAHMAGMVATPESMALAAGEWAGIGRVYDSAGRDSDAWAAWSNALSGEAGDLDPACAVRLWREMAARRRRSDAWAEACALWETWAARVPGDVEPLVERAKYEEWTAHNPMAALRVTLAALDRAAQLPRSLEQTLLIEDLAHRRERLERKIARREKDAGGRGQDEP